MTPAVLLEAPGCSEMVAARVLRDVIRDLYRSTRLWVYTDATASIDTAGVITLSPPAETEVVEVSHLRTDDGVISARTVTADRFFAYESGDMQAVADIEGVWTVRPAPAIVTSATALLQLAPTQASTGIADTQAHRHLRLFQHLALANLLSMPRQPWSAPNYAGTHEAKAMGLLIAAKRSSDGWSTRRTPVVGYGGI